MRLTILLACAVSAGCSALPPAERHAEGCLTVAAGSDGLELRHDNHRVLDDDLVAATAESPAAHELAVKSRVHRWVGFGTLVLGGILFAPGIGLIAAGGARRDASQGASGAVLTVGGVGGIAAGIVLVGKGRDEAGRAIEGYNQERNWCK
jgi:hypothetical protein